MTKNRRQLIIRSADGRYLARKSNGYYGWTADRSAARIFRNPASASVQARRWNGMIEEVSHGS